MTVASYISFLRILLIIPIIILSSYQTILTNFVSLFLFLIAGFTDYLDGYIARKTNTETNFGALLDLLADKLLVCIVLIWFLFLYKNSYLLFPVILIVSRELSISSVRLMIVEKEGMPLPRVSFLGKFKTAFQIVSISFLFISTSFNFAFYSFSIVCLWIVAGVSFYSFVDYLNKWKL